MVAEVSNPRRRSWNGGAQAPKTDTRKSLVGCSAGRGLFHRTQRHQIHASAFGASRVAEAWQPTGFGAAPQLKDDPSIQQSADMATARYYRSYIMGNEFGELPHLACHGMLARTHAVQHVLKKGAAKSKSPTAQIPTTASNLSGGQSDLHGAMPQGRHRWHLGGSRHPGRLQRAGHCAFGSSSRRPILSAVLIS